MSMGSLFLSQAVQFIFAGLSSGSIYALVALGFNIIYNTTLVVNLAQGEFLMLGALTMISLRVVFKVPIVLALPLATLIVGFIGILFDRFVIRPLKKPSLMLLILLTLGGSTFLKGVALLIWGKDPYSAPPFMRAKSISILGATFSPQILWVIGTLGIVSVILWFFFERTLLGKAMKACAENPRAASLMGVNVNNFVTTSYFLGGAIGALGGIGLGTPVLRLKGYYLAIATIGFGLIIQSIFVTLSQHTGGPDGFRDIVPLKIMGYVFKSDSEYYYPVWTIAMVILLLTRNIVRSRVGRAMLALRGDDVAASAMGVDIAKYKVQAFVLSAAYASLAGSLYAHSSRFISPQIADLSSSVEMIIMMVLGGIRTVFGVLIGTAIMKSIPEILESFLDYQMVTRGAILIVLLLYMPQGLIGVTKDFLGRLRVRRIT